MNFTFYFCKLNSGSLELILIQGSEFKVDLNLFIRAGIIMDVTLKYLWRVSANDKYCNNLTIIARGRYRRWSRSGKSAVAIDNGERAGETVREMESGRSNSFSAD